MNDENVFDPSVYDESDLPESVHTPRCDVCSKVAEVGWYEYKRIVEDVDSGEVMEATTWRAVCESCRRKRRQPSFDHRPTLLEIEKPGFTTSVLIGKVGQAALESVLVHFSYAVYPHGFESVFGGAASAIKTLEPTETAIRIRSMPDILAYRKERDEIVLIEVKGTTGNPAAWKLDRHVLRRYLDHWPMALLVVASSTKSEFYCTFVEELRPFATAAKALPHPDMSAGAVKLDLTRPPWTKLADKLNLDRARYDVIRSEVFESLRRWCVREEEAR